MSIVSKCNLKYVEYDIIVVRKLKACFLVLTYEGEDGNARGRDGKTANNCFDQSGLLAID